MRDGRRQRGEAPPLRRLYEWVQVLACAVLAVVLVFTFGVRLVTVSGPSMRETLQDGDCLLVVNAPLCGDFAAGDIVILRRESFRDGEPIVKRVVAAGGQTVDIDFAAGVVYVDGRALEEDYQRRMVGQVYPVLLEETQGAYTVGHAPNYVRVYVPGDLPRNRVLPVRITGLHQDGVVGAAAEAVPE